MWVLDHAKGDYRLKLGMGKPLGMGAVKIESELYLSDRTKRYTQLFDGDQWAIEENSNTSTKVASCISAFECYILKNIAETEHPKDCKATHLYELPRIQMLLAMLNWANHPSYEQTKYMELDDFKHRKVLPNPLDVMNLPDNRRFSSVNPSSENVKKQSDSSKPKLKKNEQCQKDNSGNVNLATERPRKKPKSKF